MLYNTEKLAGLFNRAEPLTNRENLKRIPVVVLAVHVSIKRMLSKFQTCFVELSIERSGCQEVWY